MTETQGPSGFAGADPGIKTARGSRAVLIPLGYDLRSVETVGEGRSPTCAWFWLEPLIDRL